LTPEARRIFLNELLALGEQTGQALVSDHEVRLIRERWEKGQTRLLLKELDLDCGIQVPHPERVAL
jgi:hypothetical protein